MKSFEDNIEKEYHERFQDFEEMPDDAVWSKIQESIASKPEKRPIIFWWNSYRSVGVAASVMLGLLAGGYLFLTFNQTKQYTVSDKITISTQKWEKKQATQTTQFLSKRSALKYQVQHTSELKNEEKISPKSDNIRASKKINKNESKSIEVLHSETDIAILKRNSEKTESVRSKATGTLTKQENLLKTIAIFDDINAGKQNILTQEFGFLLPKGIDIQVISRNLNGPILSQAEPVYAFEEPRQERLVFIPPTEIYANVSPMLNYYVFSPNRADNFVVKDFNTSSDRLSFAAQLGVVYPLSKKLDIRTGLSFMAGKSNFSYGLTNNNQKVVKVIDELNIEVQPVNSINSEQRNWQYLEIQSDLLYAIKQLHAVSVGFRAGVQTSALNKPVFNGRIGYRISKPVNNRVALWLEPSVVLSLSSQQSLDNHFLYRTTGFSLNMGVSLLRQD